MREEQQRQEGGEKKILWRGERGSEEGNVLEKGAGGGRGLAGWVAGLHCGRLNERAGR